MSLYNESNIIKVDRSTGNGESTNGFNEYVLRSEYATGKILVYRSDDISLLYQDFEISTPFRVAIDHDRALLKCQFELFGGSRFVSNHQSAKSIIIDSNQCQFLHIQKPSGFLEYFGSRRVLDIQINKDYLLSLLKDHKFSKEFIHGIFHKDWVTLGDQAMSIDKEQHDLIEKMLNHPYASSFASTYIYTLSTQLILSIFFKYRFVNNKKNLIHYHKDLSLFLDIKAFLENNLDSQILLSDISEKFSINEFKLKRGFKMFFGTSVISYWRDCRMDYAYKMLTSGQYSVKEVAYTMGFNYPEHFTKCFYNRFKVLPKQCTKEIHSQNLD